MEREGGGRAYNGGTLECRGIWGVLMKFYWVREESL